jgi:hypothetical protein
MTSVRIVPEVDSTERKISRTLLLTVFGVLAFVLIDRIIFRRQVNPLDLTAFAIIFAGYSFWSDKPSPVSDLEIDTDQIRLVEQGSVKRTVSQDRIRYVREWGGNIFRGQ